MYVMSTGERLSDPEAMSCIRQLIADGADLSIIDPGHQLVRQDPVLLARVLEDRYGLIFIQDAIETGHCILDANRQPLFRTRAPTASFVGLALEAYVVRCINSNMRHVGRLTLQWCSARSSRPCDRFVDKFFAIGTGLKTTREQFSFFYAPQSGVDVIFLRRARNSAVPEITHEPLTYMGTQVSAGIQIKAIRGNELTEIIQPMLSNQYLCVLTLLKHPNGMHSADVCMDIVRRMVRQGEITETQRVHLERGICRPEEIGLDQQEINNYYDYAWAAAECRAPFDQAALDAITMEVKNWKYSQAGVLLPGSELQ